MQTRTKIVRLSSSRKSMSFNDNHCKGYVYRGERNGFELMVMHGKNCLADVNRTSEKHEDKDFLTDRSNVMQQKA